MTRARLFGTSNPNWRNAGVRTCDQCGEIYHSYVKARRFCGRVCTGRFISALKLGKPSPLKGIPRPHLRGMKKALPMCSVCGTREIKSRKSRFCAGCGNGSGRFQERKCVVCSAIFSHRLPRKSCSPACRKQLRTTTQYGSLSHRWRGGLTDENRRLRNSVKCDDWRRAVFGRDNFTCVQCGTRGGRLHADHIKPWSLYPDLRFDIGNGRTLCKPCHMKTDTWGYRTAVRANHAVRT